MQEIMIKRYPGPVTGISMPPKPRTAITGMMTPRSAATSSINRYCRLCSIFPILRLRHDHQMLWWRIPKLAGGGRIPCDAAPGGSGRHLSGIRKLFAETRLTHCRNPDSFSNGITPRSCKPAAASPTGPCLPVHPQALSNPAGYTPEHATP